MKKKKKSAANHLAQNSETKYYFQSRVSHSYITISGKEKQNKTNKKKRS